MLIHPLAFISRESLTKAIRFMSWIGLLFLLWVIFEYIFIGSGRSIPIEKHLIVHQSEFNPHKAIVIQKQSIPLLLIAKNERNQLTANRIYLAIGEEGCVVLPISLSELKESCSEAQYDLFGKPKSPSHKPLTAVPYSFNQDTKNYSFTLNSNTD